MGRQFETIEIHQLEPVDSHVPVIGPIKHTIDAKGWLSKWLVKKLISNGVLKEAMPDMRVDRKYVNPSEKALLERIMDAVYVSHLPLRSENMRFVIGAEDFHSDEFRTAFAFVAGPFARNHEIFGVPVQVVPWMKGWAVIPERLT